jgi:hypothetical protein
MSQIASFRRFSCVGASLACMLAAGCGDDGDATSSAGQGGNPSTGGGGAGAASSGGFGGDTSSGGSAAGGDSAGGAGGDAPGGAGGDGQGGSGGSATDCGAIGSPCTVTCPDGLQCQSSVGEGFCAPAAPECGGFAGAMCPATHPNCLFFNGADYGPCATDAVKACICQHAPNAVTGC